jgi:hypothetical protein
MDYKKDERKTNLVGVIPAAGRQKQLGYLWPDSCQPLKENHLAIERSVLECAYAGCKSIWIVCNDDVAPLIKMKIGDAILDPYCYNNRKYFKYFEDNKKYIPIFYSPIHPKDRDRRDSLGWSVLHGALAAFYVSRNISSWLAPHKYYVSFPYGIYDPRILQNKKSLLSSNNSLYLSYKGKTVRENMYLGFTFSPEDWKQIHYDLKNNCSGGDRNLSFEKRWSSRHFKLDEIFKNDRIVIGVEKEVDWYYDLDSWSNLVLFYKSEHHDKYEIPSDKIIGGYKLNRIGK